MTRKTIICCAFSSVTFICILLFLWLKCPYYLLYHEQYQLFLLTWDYFASSITEPGGFANYLSEFIVQFYYVPIYGAILTALLLTITQVFSGAACRHCRLPLTAYVLSTLPSVVYLGAMGDENVLLSFAVAMMLSFFFLFLISSLRYNSFLSDTLAIFIGFTILYWLAGPFAFTFIVAAGILRQRYLSIAICLLSGIAIVMGIHSLWFEQFPLSRILLGINYYRIPETYPTIFYIIAAVTALIPSVTLIKTDSGKSGYPNNSRQPEMESPSILAAAVVFLFAIIYPPASFNKEKGNVFEYNSLVRQGRWSDIIEKARKEMPSDNFSLQALNLALGMKGELTESMFHFNQKGIESLIGKDRLDNTSQLITAEALFRLGLTNIAFSTTFDLQEAIMNDRKSGRLMKRMAECMIINGNYKVAEKYIGLLRHTLYYSDWADNAAKFIGNDSAVEAHPVYGLLRRNNFRETAFYDHSQLVKILAIHSIDNESSNPLAWQYFCAAAMLKGDLDFLAGVHKYLFDKTGSLRLPRHVQEAIALVWTFSHETFDGIPFPLSQEVKRQTAALAQAVSRNQNNTDAWNRAAPGSYGIYYLKNVLTGKAEPVNTEYRHTHE